MTKTNSPSPETLEKFASIIGKANIITTDADMAPYLTEQRNLYFGKAAAILRPASPKEVADCLKIADDTKTAIIPQGGNTGLVGGQIPDETGAQIVLSLARLNNIRKVDPANNTITADAGCILSEIQQAADGVDRFFPLSLGSQGSCQIGGNLASNAGGVNVLAYGNMRALTLGIEVALADGRIWDGLRGLRKDNTGYDLKDLFVGSEGTLGIITGAVLKLFPKPKDQITAWAGIPSPQAALDLLHLAQSHSGGQVTSFELMAKFGLEITLEHISNTRAPLEGTHPWHILITLSGGGTQGMLAPLMQDILAEGLERGLIEDAIIAQNETQANALWHLRESLPEAQKHAGASIKHDISVPLSEIPAFMADANETALKIVPGCRPMPFGHIGDGNLHYNITQPPDMAPRAYLALTSEMNQAIYQTIAQYGGSISAEHGIGQMKRDIMETIKSPVELAMMRDIKRMLDPNNILNPNKLLPPEK